MCKIVYPVGAARSAEASVVSSGPNPLSRTAHGRSLAAARFQAGVNPAPTVGSDRDKPCPYENQICYVGTTLVVVRGQGYPPFPQKIL